jgi:hypothetical protein
LLHGGLTIRSGDSSARQFGSAMRMRPIQCMQPCDTLGACLSSSG